MQIPITVDELPQLVEAASGDFSFVTINQGTHKPHKKGNRIRWTFSLFLGDYSWAEAFPIAWNQFGMDEALLHG